MSAPGASLLRRLAAWFRRGWDAELLAVAPAKDETGAPLVWDFPHPVNRSPLWRILRPWYLFPALFVVLVAGGAMLTRGRLLAPSELLERLLVGGVVAAVFAPSIRRKLKPRVERIALRAYRRYRWRATSELDAAMRDALEKRHEGERSPKRLLDTRAP